MNLDEILQFLEVHGTEQVRKIFTNHGIPDPKFGVKVADLKIIQKKVKKNYDLSKALYDTGIYDAMYLAGLIADEKLMTKEDLSAWMDKAPCESIASNTVAWIAAESSYGIELAREWIRSENETVAAGGYSTYCSLVATVDNEKLDTEEIEAMLDDIVEMIHSEREEVKYQMNGFVIAVGGYMPQLRKKALAYGAKIGKVSVDVGNTACKVPLIVPYIEKMEKRNVKKKKRARC